MTAWADGNNPPLMRITDPAEHPPLLPADLSDAEEAHLVWRWLTSGKVRLIETSGVVAEPRLPVRSLDQIAV